jgi:hypothetical protein
MRCGSSGEAAFRITLDTSSAITAGSRADAAHVQSYRWGASTEFAKHHHRKDRCVGGKARRVQTTLFEVGALC